MDGINAPIGFDPNCPLFDESIVAYLHRFILEAEDLGFETDGVTYRLPDGPFAMLTHSHGGLKAHAFLVNFPEYAARCLAVISLAGPHMGTPLGSPEWMRHTVSRVGIFKPNITERVLDLAYDTDFISVRKQSDLNLGWGNSDAQGRYGLPYIAFTAWTRAEGCVPRVLSPRDANQTGARTLPGYELDTTFEPQVPLETYCGALDLITPAYRGDLYTDKFFLYAGYLQPGRGILAELRRAGDGVAAGRATDIYENLGLRLVNLLLGCTRSAGADWPMSPYRMTDGAIPLQSQLMLDGKETEPIFATCELCGWRVPAFWAGPNWNVIHEHTLVNPDRIRILPGWSHLETVNGRYDKNTHHSALFSMIAHDLLSVIPLGDAPAD